MNNVKFRFFTTNGNISKSFPLTNGKIVKKSAAEMYQGKAEIKDQRCSVQRFPGDSGNGSGVAYLKLGKAIRYPQEVVEKFESENMCNQGGSV